MNPKDLNSSSNSHHPENSADLPGSTHTKHFETPVLSETKSRPGGTTDLTHSTHSTHSRLNTLTTAFFYLSILFFIIGFNFSDVMVGNWYQQFMPNLNNQPIQDITFVDSLTGWAVTRRNTSSDSAFILKTTNSGDNWNIVSRVNGLMTRIIFMNQNTGYVAGSIYYNFSFHFLKTTNGGLSWDTISSPVRQADLAVLNEDTIWVVDDNSLSGGVYRTTTGGSTWELQQGFGSSNPDKIYMFDRNIGFIGNFFTLRKTTNGGFSWTLIPGEVGFRDMYFSDSLTGWKANDSMKKSTNGGLSWQTQQIPRGPNISFGIVSFSNINSDTIWGSGGVFEYPNLQNRGMLYRTTNGGSNWLFQIPDTNINIYFYGNTNFYSKLTGWAYGAGSGIHTTNGGDTNFILPVSQISSEVAVEFKLFQNYPNPFNPKTIIRFQIIRLSDVTLKIYDITGREIITLVNEEKSAGTYEVDFSGSGYSSGVYFYSLLVDGKLIDTKKMLLIK